MQERPGARTCWAWWLLALLALAWPCLAQTRAVELPEGTHSLGLDDRVTYYHDVGAAEDATRAFNLAARGAFSAVPDGNPAFGFQKGAYWFHATLVNRTPDELKWLLVQAYPLSDHVDLYLRYPDGHVEHDASGDAVPFSNRAIRYRHPNFMLDLPVGQPVEMLLRVQSESSMQVPLTLYTPTAFAEVLRDAQFSTGIYYGILLALLFYNLVLWVMLRDQNYFWYVLHVVAFGLVLFSLNGYGFEFLWPNSAWLAEKSIPLSICLALVGMQQFSRKYLELPERWPRGNMVSLGVIAFFVLLGFASLQMPYRVATPLASRAVLVGVLWIVVAAVVMLRRGYRPARLFLLAWFLFLLGTAAFTLLAFGAIPDTFYTRNGVQIGSALEMLLLSIGLGARYAQLRAENERIASEATQRLENQVAQRTRELRGTLLQLEDAHRQLRDSSQRDGLTGLYNRAHFREAFAALLERATQAGLPVSLLMIDLDHFKSINDRHGHLAGDDCLRWAAQRIDQALADVDAVAARYGGEEFIVGLGGHDVQSAVEVAERVRRSLHLSPCPTRGREIPVTASFGVHELLPGETDRAGIDAALQAADTALYSAKEGGRDQVIASIRIS